MLTPVTKSLAGPARKQAVPARSYGTPQRPAGVRARIFASRSGMWRRAPAVRSVSIQPGRIALTWMLSSAQAIAHDFVICTTPPLLAAYGIENGCPNRLVIDPMLTILPPPPCFIGPYAACEQ